MQVPEFVAATLVVDSAFDGRIMNVALDPSGRLLAVCSGGARVRVFDLDAHLRQVLAAPGAAIGSLAWSPDGKRLAGASFRGQGGLVIWSVADGKLDRALPDSHGKPALVEWSPDGRRIAVVNGRRMHLVDAATLGVLGSPTRSGSVTSLAFSPTGGLVAVGGMDPRLSLIDGQGALQYSTGPSAGFSDRYDSVSFSPDGKSVAALIGRGRIELIDVDHPSKPPAVLATDDAQVVAFGSKRGSLVVWGTRRLTVQDVEHSSVLQMNPHTEGQAMVSSRLDVRKGGRLVAVASAQGASVWDLQRMAPILRLPNRPNASGATARVGFSRDGALLYLVRESTTVWSTRTGRVVFHLASNDRADRATRLALSQERALVAVADSSGRVTLGSTETGEVLRQHDTKTTDIACLAFEAAGRVLAIRTANELEVRRFSADDGAAQKPKQAPCIEPDLLSPARPQLALLDDQLGVVDARSGALVKSIGRYFSAAAWAPDGSVLFLANKGAIAKLDPRSFKLTEWKLLPVDSVTGLAVSRDGRSLIVGTEVAVQVLDMQTGSEKPSPEGFGAGVAAFALHPSGDFIASADALGVRLDRLTDRARIHLRPFASGARADALAFTADGVVDGDADALELAHYRVGDDVATSELRPAASMPPEFRTKQLVAGFFAGEPIPKAPARVKRR